MRTFGLALVLGLALVACKDRDEGKPTARPRATPRAAPAEPPPPRPPPLAAGTCCCAASLKGDELVEIHDQAGCSAELGGACVDPGRCWLADPPAVVP